MGVFNIIETFFFLSLAITFILILLLVNHFKQRLSMLEQKCDTMFEIINNIVQEMSGMKKAMFMSNVPMRPSMYIVPPSKSNPEVFTNVSLDDANPNDDTTNKIIVSDDEEDDEEDEDEEDEEDEDEEDEDPMYPEQKIKIVNVDIQDKMDVEDILSDGQMDDVVDGDLEENELELSEIPVIIVDKIENVLNENTYQVNEKTNTDNQREVYNKMSVQELKKVVITKGLCSDVSKLKKNDLLKLLEAGENA